MIALFAALACGLIVVAPAIASDVSAIYKDCETNGKLTGHYTRAQLQAALNQMPSEVAEYSSCSDLIQQALLRASHGSGNGGPKAHAAAVGGGRGGRGGRGGHSGKGAVGKHRRAGDPKARYARTASAGALPGADIRPDSTGTGSSLPTPLIVVLILLALAAVGGGAVAIRRRLVARHGM